MKKILLWILAIAVVAGAAGAYYVYRSLIKDPFAPLYAAECAGCHGDQQQGSASGPSLLSKELLSTDLILGQGVRELTAAIAAHPFVAGAQVPSRTLTNAEARGLAILIGETQTDRQYRTFEVAEDLQIPSEVVRSDAHNFRLEVVTQNLDPLPFSVAPLPEGGFLVTEKQRGLRHVSADGTVSELIEGTPEVFSESFEVFLPIGHGWMLDVALHPRYADTGWVYLHYTQRCEDCTGSPQSLNTVVRGRIRDGQWIDQELIWQPDARFQSIIPDIGAGGRLAFDDQDHLYISVGLKGSSNFDAIQDLSTPSGKIHRVNLDGSVPPDNPFLTTTGAMPTVWTYGHRSPQGLEFNRTTRQMWETEMGPRGGDEINLLRPGANYGWPLTSNGIDYDGTHVEYGNELNIEFELSDIQQPAVDLTPGPAVSSFAFYQGELFPNWAGNMLVGSLAARELYRVVLNGNSASKVEKILTNAGRIRDVEVGPDGLVYLLLEHPDGGHLVRLLPAG